MIMYLIKFLIFLSILIYASVKDIKTHTVDYYTHIFICIAAFINTELEALPNMVIGALLSGLIFLIVYSICKNKPSAENKTIGGGDMLFSTACLFFFGINGFIGLIIGLLLAVIVNLILKAKKEFALIPYLSIGFLTAYFII